jgi:hypothetical protein
MKYLEGFNLFGNIPGINKDDILDSFNGVYDENKFEIEIYSNHVVIIPKWESIRGANAIFANNRNPIYFPLDNIKSTLEYVIPSIERKYVITKIMVSHPTLIDNGQVESEDEIKYKTLDDLLIGESDSDKISRIVIDIKNRK